METKEFTVEHLALILQTQKNLFELSHAGVISVKTCNLYFAALNNKYDEIFKQLDI